MKNEITTTTNGTVVPILSAADFANVLRAGTGLSPLADGYKFEADELAKAHHVILKDYDIVSYGDGAESKDFAVWKIEAYFQGKDGNVEMSEGYTNGGAALTNLAKFIHTKSLEDELHEHGVMIKCEWTKTSNKKDYLKIEIL